MASDPLFCKNCRYSSLPINKLESLCLHAEAVIDAAPDLVTGEPRRRAHAYEMRQMFGKCGPDGRLWSLEASRQRVEPDA